MQIILSIFYNHAQLIVNCYSASLTVYFNVSPPLSRYFFCLSKDSRSSNKGSINYGRLRDLLFKIGIPTCHGPCPLNIALKYILALIKL